MSEAPREIAPGLLHWRAHHPEIGVHVSSHHLVAPGVVLDPQLPEGEGPGWLAHEVRQVVVTIALHTRSAPDFGLPVWAPREGLHRWEGRDDFETVPYGDGDEIAPGVRAIQVGAIAPDDYALHIADPPTLLLADALFNFDQSGYLPPDLEDAGDGIGFVPAVFAGDDAEAINRATVTALRPLLDLEWDTLLFTHGPPITSGAKTALRRFLDAHA